MRCEKDIPSFSFSSSSFDSSRGHKRLVSFLLFPLSLEDRWLKSVRLQSTFVANCHSYLSFHSHLLFTCYGTGRLNVHPSRMDIWICLSACPFLFLFLPSSLSSHLILGARKQIPFPLAVKALFPPSLTLSGRRS